MEMMLFDELYEKQMAKELDYLVEKGYDPQMKEVSNMEPTIRDANVEHPDHYQHGGIETIDVINAWTDDLDGEIAFDIGNAIKYISRWKNKNGVEDLRKAIWYINRVIELESSD